MFPAPHRVRQDRLPHRQGLNSLFGAARLGKGSGMNRRCVALLSGGLDSKLAIRMMLDQGIEVEAINFRTVFGCCKDDAARTAHELGVRLTVLDVGEDYLDVVKRPTYGYGKGM